MQDSDYGDCLGHDGLVNGARCTYHNVAHKACQRCKRCCLKMQEVKEGYVCKWKKHKVKVAGAGAVAFTIGTPPQ